MKTKRIWILISDKLYTDLKLHSEQESETITRVITQAIKQYIYYNIQWIVPRQDYLIQEEPTIPTPQIPTTTQTPYTQIPEQSYQTEEPQELLPEPPYQPEEEQPEEVELPPEEEQPEQPEELSELELALLSESEEPKIIQKPVSLNKQIQYYVSWFYPIYDNKLNTRESIEKELRKYKIDIKLLEEFTYKFIKDYDHDPVPSVKHLVDLYNLK